MRSRCERPQTRPAKQNHPSKNRNSAHHLASWCFSLLSCLGLAALLGCASTGSNSVQVSHRPFGQTADGKEVSLFTLRNSKGATADISSYGGIVTSLKVPDRDGKLGDVVLGYDNLADYIKGSPYFGALIGR